MNEYEVNLFVDDQPWTLMVSAFSEEEALVKAGIKLGELQQDYEIVFDSIQDQAYV